MGKRKLNLMQKVFQWGIDRDIYKNGIKGAQIAKFAEEIIEFHLAKDELEIKDAIGDTLVTLINLIGIEYCLEAKQELTAEELLSMYMLKSSEPTNVELAKKYTKAEVGSASLGYLHNILKALIRDNITVTQGFNFVFDAFILHSLDCLELSYNVIKNRKGKLSSSGNFVKEEDLI